MKNKHMTNKHKHGEDLPKYQSSCQCVIVNDMVDCCMNCIRRRKKTKNRSWKSHRKTKYKI